MRIVIKVGTHAIADKSGRPDHVALKKLVKQICDVRAMGHEVIFVSSGAVAAGVEALGLQARPKDVNAIQMCAAVGQARFIYEYERLFGEHGVKIGQLLLTHDDFEMRPRALNIKSTIGSLLKNSIVPIINENDVVADEELKGQSLGDNDYLSFLIAKLLKADALVLLTTVDGLLDEKGRRIPEVSDMHDVVGLVHPGEKGRLSKGGMDTKLKAVRAAVKSGIDVYIANGRKKCLVALFSGRSTGTFFPADVLS